MLEILHQHIPLDIGFGKRQAGQEYTQTLVGRDKRRGDPVLGMRHRPGARFRRGGHHCGE